MKTIANNGTLFELISKFIENILILLLCGTPLALAAFVVGCTEFNPFGLSPDMLFMVLIASVYFAISLHNEG